MQKFLQLFKTKFKHTAWPALSCLCFFCGRYFVTAGGGVCSNHRCCGGAAMNNRWAAR